MSYSIQEGVDELRKKLAAEEAILAKYPKASLQALPNDSQVWVCQDAVPTDIDIVTCGNNVHICPFETVGGMRVYKNTTGAPHWHLLSVLRNKHPEIVREIVRIALSY